MMKPSSAPLLIEDLVPPADDDNARAAQQAGSAVAAIATVEPV